jgi:hypothetical protein
VPCASAQSGIPVTVFEEGAQVGGQLAIATAAPNRRGWARLLAFYASELERPRSRGAARPPGGRRVARAVRRGRGGGRRRGGPPRGARGRARVALLRSAGRGAIGAPRACSGSSSSTTAGAGGRA